MADHLKIGIIHEMSDVLFGPGIEVINADDFIAKVKQLFTEMGAEKACLVVSGRLKIRKRTAV